MKRIFFWIYLMLKKQLKNPFIVAILIAIPVVTLIVTSIPSLNKSDKIRIGLVLMDEDDIAVKTVDKLVNGDYNIDFYIAGSRDELIDDIMDKKTECGYVFFEDITTKISDEDYDEIVECIINESNYISSMSDEIVFSELFKEFADNIMVDFIKSESVFSSNTTKAIIMANAKYDKYLEGDETFHLSFTVLDTDGTTSEIQNTAGKFPLRPILYILIFAGGLFGVAWYLEDEAKGTYVTLGRSFRIIGKPVYAFIGAFLFWISASISLIIVGQSIGVRTIAMGFLYIVLVTLYAWFMGLIFRKTETFIGVTLFLIVACFIFCPVFVNISLYVPAAKYISAILLPNYFI